MKEGKADRMIHGWAGLGGVPPKDRARAYHWEARLRWPMALIALLALPAFYFDAAGSPMYQAWGSAFSIFIVLAFALELGVMLALVRQKLRYLQHNWLLLVILLTGTVALIRPGYLLEPELYPLLRLLVFGLLISRVFGSIRRIASPSGMLTLLLLSASLLGIAGLGFYWLEPTVHSYGQGVWLAFTSGATVGYGDIVPTTPASRFFAVIMVLLGYALLSLFSAGLVALIIGEDEQQLRHQMHRDILHLHKEMAALREDLQRLSQKAGVEDDASGRPPPGPEASG
ncbi:potassium channel family protein [Thermithiobacillus plumbiphilus]|uniref:Ion channel n=1 Tax=Thermithiobacillus plumbiphilus TaxID=1729899 RepID=A0ABU9DAT7_9PROT